MDEYPNTLTLHEELPRTSLALTNGGFTLTSVGLSHPSIPSHNLRILAPYSERCLPYSSLYGWDVGSDDSDAFTGRHGSHGKNGSQLLLMTKNQNWSLTPSFVCLSGYIYYRFLPYNRIALPYHTVVRVYVDSYTSFLSISSPGQRASPKLANMSIEKKPRTEDSDDDNSEIDLYSFHEQHAGRLIIDPAYVCPPLNPSN